MTKLAGRFCSCSRCLVQGSCFEEYIWIAAKFVSTLLKDLFQQQHAFLKPPPLVISPTAICSVGCNVLFHITACFGIL